MNHTKLLRTVELFASYQLKLKVLNYLNLKDWHLAIKTPNRHKSPYILQLSQESSSDSSKSPLQNTDEYANAVRISKFYLIFD